MWPTTTCTAIAAAILVCVALSEPILVDAKRTARTVVDIEEECNWPLRSQIGSDDYIDRKEFTLVVLDRSVTVPIQNGVEEQLNAAFDELKGESYCNNKTWGIFYSSEGDKLCNSVSLPIYPDLKQKYESYDNRTFYENSAKYEALYALKVCEEIVKVIDSFSIGNPSDSPSTKPSQFQSDAPSMGPTTSYSPSISLKPSYFPSKAPSHFPSIEPSTSTQPSKAPSKTQPSKAPSKDEKFLPSTAATVGLSVAGALAGAACALCGCGLKRHNRRNRLINHLAFAIPPIPSDNESDFAVEDLDDLEDLGH